MDEMIIEKDDVKVSITLIKGGCVMINGNDIDITTDNKEDVTAYINCDFEYFLKKYLHN